MFFPKFIKPLLDKAISKYYIRPYELKDKEIVHSIFTEGMMYYGVNGGNRDKDFSQYAHDPEYVKFRQDMEHKYRIGFESYVKYSLADPNLSDIENYWSLARRAIFLVCVDRETHQVIGTVAIQCGSVLNCDYYANFIKSHRDEMLQCEKSCFHSFDDKAAELGMLPSELYDDDNPRYFPETYRSLPVVKLPEDGSVVENDSDYLTQTPAPLSDEQLEAEGLDKHSDNGYPMPNGFYRRFEPQNKREGEGEDGVEDGVNVDIPLPVGITSNTYSDFVKLFNSPSSQSVSPLNVVNEDSAQSDVECSLTNVISPTASLSLPSQYSYTSHTTCGVLAPVSHDPSLYEECELRRMSVTHSHRTDGAAYLLIVTALKVARDVLKFPLLHLSTSINMSRAVKFYRKMGLRETFVRYDGRGEGEDDTNWEIVHFQYLLEAHAHKTAMMKYHHCNATKL